MLVVRSIFILILFTTLGCSLNLREKKNFKGISLKKSQKSQSGPGGEPLLTLVGMEAHRYLAKVKVPRSLSASVLQIRGEQTSQVNIKDLEEVAVDLKDDQSYLIDLKESDKESAPLLHRWSFKTPKDFVASEIRFDQKLTETDGTYFFKGGRFFISSAVVKPSVEKTSMDQKPEHLSLVTEGRSLVIDVEELIAEDGTIMTFPVGQKAPKDQGGRSGGLITIKTKRAKGKLKFVLRGEEGGNGSDGPPFTSRAPKGKKGSAALGLLLCLSEPSDGRQGLPGLKGQKGFPGKKGGDSGRLNLEVAEGAPGFTWEVVKEPGKAGAPGGGGPGQLGGLGGDGGTWAPGCSGTRKGPEGPSGPNGDPGDQEPDGQTIEECYSIAEGFGRCSR